MTLTESDGLRNSMLIYFNFHHLPYIRVSLHTTPKAKRMMHRHQYHYKIRLRFTLTQSERIINTVLVTKVEFIRKYCRREGEIFVTKKIFLKVINAHGVLLEKSKMDKI